MRLHKRSKWPVIVVIVVVVLGLGAASFFFLIKKNPSQLASTELSQGLAAQVAGQLDVAAADYNQVLKNDPKNKFAYFNLGVIAQGQGNNPQAETDFARRSISIRILRMPCTIWQ